MTQVTQINPTWLGPFFGSSLGFLNYEILTVQHIGKKDRAEESALMRTKWFDYRRLHPMQATYFLAHSYNLAYGRFMATAVNRDMRYMKGFKGHDFLEAREKLSFWRLRQLCDRFGLPYDFFMRHAMYWYAQRATNVAHGVGKYALVPPRPSQIMANEDLIAEVMLAWEDAMKAGLRVATDPWFLVSQFNGHDVQREHESFVVRQIMSRTHKHYALNAALYVHDVLRFEEAVRQFGPDVVSQAISVVDPSVR